MHSTTNTASSTANHEVIAERLSRYRPHSLSDVQIRVLLPAMREVVLAAGPRSYVEARNWMSVLATFLGEASSAAPAGLGEVLTDAAISLWVSQSIQKGGSPHTLKTQRGTLVRLLGAQRGALTSQRRSLAGRRDASPLSPDQLTALLAGCNADSLSARRGALAHLLAGVPVGTVRARLVADGSGLTLTTPSRTFPVPPSSVELDGVDGGFLNKEDWRALKDQAAALEVNLTPALALRTAREVALNDTSLTLVERITRYAVSEQGCTSVLRSARDMGDDAFEAVRDLLRDGVSGVCTDPLGPAPSLVPQISGTKEAGQKVTRKTSRAAAQRLAAQRMTEDAARASDAEPVIHYLATYVPDEDDETWDQIAADVRSAVGAARFTSIETARKHAVALNAFLRWRARHGLETTISAALTFAHIDEFFARGIADLSERSRRDYRSRLRTLAQRANASVGAPPALRLGHNQVNAGYSAAEERLIRRAALNQFKPRARQRLCAIVGFCAGAGLSSEELRALHRRDCTIHDDGTIEVRVPGGRARRTVVRRIYERHVLIALEGLGDDALVLTALKSASPITSMLKDADLYGDIPAIDTRRLRTTWIEWLMDQRVPLALAVEASGLRSSRTFWDILSRRQASVSLDGLREGGSK